MMLHDIDQLFGYIPSLYSLPNLANVHGGLFS
jgi:hypothetical protein